MDDVGCTVLRGITSQCNYLFSCSLLTNFLFLFFFFQAEDGIRDHCVTGVQTCALPICCRSINMAARAVRKKGIRISTSTRQPRPTMATIPRPKIDNQFNFWELNLSTTQDRKSVV